MVFDQMRHWYQGQVDEVSRESSTRVLLQVVVLSAMKPRRLTPRVLLQASLWSVVLIVLAFILIYSVLLTFVDRRGIATLPGRAHLGENTPVRRHTHDGRKVKFRSKVRMAGSGGMSGRDLHRKVLWNSEDYFGNSSIHPSCHNDSLLTIIITSSPDHIEQRTQIRRTWCNSSASGQLTAAWQCLFLVARSTPELDAAIAVEAGHFNDVLVGKYVDSYRNLTFKVLHGLDWSTNVCPTPYTLKTDDDCFVNTLQLIPLLRHKNQVVSGLYVGNVNLLPEKRIVIRNSASKWSVSRDDYPNRLYPPYASGTGYVLSRDMVESIAAQSRYIKPIPNEDAYIGIVADAVGAESISSPRFTLFMTGLRLCNYLYVLVAHGVKPDMQPVIHAQMMQAPKHCSGSDAVLNSWS